MNVEGVWRVEVLWDVKNRLAFLHVFKLTNLLFCLFHLSLDIFLLLLFNP